MKILSPKLQSNSGSVLATTMIITFVIGATLASFLLLTENQTFANARSQSWNHTLAVTEAGVEEALQEINKYNYDPNKLYDWAVDAGNLVDSWQSGPAAEQFWTYRLIGSPLRGYYYVIVDNTRRNFPKITSRGVLYYDFDFNHGSPSMAAAGTTSSTFRQTMLQRTVVVNTRRDTLWPVAMLADREIDTKGNNISTDSFDSSDPNFSDWSWDPLATYGIFDPNKISDNGDVATNYKIIDSINAGNADIMGHVSTGPGGTVAIGSQGSVGSMAWVSGGNTGVQDPSYITDDMNVRLNDVGLPVTTWLPLPDAGNLGTNINGVTYRHYINSGGDYKASTLSGSVYVAPGVDARVYLTDKVSLKGSDLIRITAGAKRLTIYMGGSSFAVGGGGIANETGNAAAFLYYGLPTNTKVVFGGNGSFTGAIYANHADFSMGGGGSDPIDFIGACVIRSAQMNGHYRFHYDENLANLGPSRFVASGWSEQ